MELKPGLRLKSAVCDAEVMVIKSGDAGTLTCGGAPMLGPGATADGAEPNQEHMRGCQIGKRYVTEDDSVEVLCVKGGEGSIAADGDLLLVKDTKKLPSSD